LFQCKKSALLVGAGIEGLVEKVVRECVMPKADPPMAEKLVGTKWKSRLAGLSRLLKSDVLISQLPKL
jgi:hypothetical protein